MSLDELILARFLVISMTTRKQKESDENGKSQLSFVILNILHKLCCLSSIAEHCLILSVFF